MPHDYPRWLYAKKDKENKEKEKKKEKKEKDQKESKTVKETEKERKTDFDPVNQDEFMYMNIRSRNDKFRLFMPSQHWETAKKMTKLSTKKPFVSAAVKRERQEAAGAAAVVTAQQTAAQVQKLQVPKYQPSATKFQKACGYLEREEKLKNKDFQWSTAKLVSGIHHEECSQEQRVARHCLSAAFSDAIRGNVSATAEHYDIPYYQSPLGKALPSAFLTPERSPYQTEVLSSPHPGHTLVEEAAADAAAEWETPDTTKISGVKYATKESTLQEDPLLGATAQVL